MKTLVLPFLVASLALSQEPGGQPQSLKGVVLKNKAPISSEVLRVKFPRAVDLKLSNGLALMVLEDRRLPTISLDLTIPVSPLNDPEGMPGVAEATADVMRLGTRTRNSRQLADELAGLGANLSVRTGYGSRSTHVTVSTLTENLDAVLAIFADVLLNPSFDAAEFDKYRTREIAALDQARTQPGFLANERMHRILYPSDARGNTSSSAASLRRMTPDTLRDFYTKHFTPANALLGVAGDVAPKTIQTKLEKLLGAWKRPAAAEASFTLAAPIGEKKIILVHRPNSVQSYIMIANRAINRTHPDYFAATVMNKVLGQGPAARLFRNIREDKGYTYGIGSSLTALRHTNHFSCSTSVRTEVTGSALEEILKEFRDIRDRQIAATELDNAKRSLVASFALSMESPSFILSQLLLAREYGFPANYWDTYPEQVMAITAAQAQTVAKKYVPVDNAQIVVVGDSTKIRAVLEKFGTVEEFTAEGERITTTASQSLRE